ncbi:MAG: response regulator transcription factor [Candidatus Cloacimonetes bacterium]|nr:response regulator transcription factor [Candidatus Cloacimonadota bacterium]
MSESLYKILLADDDVAGSYGIKHYLEANFSVDVTWEKDSYQVISKSIEDHYDLLLLDINMPNLNGLEILQEIRKRNQSLPTIIISVRSKEFDIIRGFELGGDDYLCKPFSLPILKARVGAQLRKKSKTLNTVVFDNYLLNYQSGSLSKENISVQLIQKETSLLRILFSESQTIHTRETLLDRIWGLDYYGTDRTVDTLIARLRSKLRKSNVKILIESVRGLGYKISSEKI